MRFRTTLILSAFLAMFSLSRAEVLNVGDAAPTLSATTEAGSQLNLGDVYKKGYTLVYFYPRASTSGCTAQGCSLRDDYSKLTEKGVSVIGVSNDPVEAQLKFKKENHFPFPLLADTNSKVIRAFGQEGPQAKRQAFLIDKNGKIVWRDLHARTTEQGEDVLAALAKLGT